MNIIPIETIERKIFLIRGKKVMLDRDLAFLYGVSTKALKQAVKRNYKRFPEDFMFELSKGEFENWRSQFVTSKSDIMGLRWMPYAFTEQGVAMLSSVLKSEKAIEVNIQIIRTFTRLRELIVSNKELRERLDKLEEKYDKQFKIIFDAMKRIFENNNKRITENHKKPAEIGFKCKQIKSKG